jgi:cytochrome P450
MEAERQVDQAIVRVRTPAGDGAWQVSGYAQVRALLSDRRLGRSHPQPDQAAWYSRTDLSGRPMGNSEAEHAEHVRWRRTVTVVFARRVERLRPRVQEIADSLLDRFVRRTQPADLHDGLSSALPTLVICELLGVPQSDQDDFRRWTEAGADNTDMATSATGMARLLFYVRGLIRRRREDPGDDVVSELISGRDRQSRLYEGNVAKLLAGILAFGRETPANSIDRGALLLLTHRAQRDALQRDPSLAARAADEVLRLFPPSAATGGGLLRYAQADIEVDGITIRPGDMVLLDVVAANRDGRVFPDADRFDIARAPNPHLTFGHGPYMCNFSALARLELEVSLRTLFGRLPALELAVPPDQLRFKSHLRTGGLVELPVTW